MKRIVNFIIDRKYLMLSIFIISAILCVYLSSKVNINYEISNYLPSSSNVKKGLDIMNDEFKEDTSSFNIMFDDLKDNEKDEIFNEIKNMDNVSDVLYDDSENYNILNHTLYKVVIDGNKDSKIASKCYHDILEKYKDKKIETSGEVSDRNTEILPKYVIVAAIAFGTIILIVMCDSVVEVFLFLFTILIAVLLNKGTNIIFSSVSNITDSISAILQLALSMDYSIMLMNRFNQAKENHKNITDAMKEALYNSFSSVSSSSVTTVVGLLALVFMSFTIGRDLGFVLAKGVLCSLISTFFVLPGLIIIFNKSINKTKKKSPCIKLDKLANICYKFRYVLFCTFILIFVCSYLLKGNLNINFLENSRDNISSIFKSENEIAVIYNNKDEDKISSICKDLDNNELLTSVLCYSNTLNDELKYDEINKKLDKLNVDTSIEDYLLKIVYYKYYTDENNKIDFNSLINFINKVVYKNDDYHIDNKIKNDINTLSYFTSKDSINKERSVKELSNIMSIDESLINDLVILYDSTDSTYKISLKDFIIFMNNNVINNKKYNIPEDISNKISMLYNIVNNLNNKLSSNELSNILGIDKDSIDMVIMYYLNNSELSNMLSINEFTNTIINNYDMIGNLIDEDIYKNIILLNKFSNKEFINMEYTSSELSEIYGIDESNINYILSLTSKDKSNLIDFNSILLNSDLISDEELIIKLNMINGIMSNIDNKYSYNEISSIINIDNDTSKMIYVLNEYENTKISLNDFINLVVENNLVDNESINELYMIINNLNNKYSSNEMGKMLGSNSNINLIYGLYSFNNGNDKISINEFVNFIIDNVLNSKEYSSKFDSESNNKLYGLNRIISSVQSNTKLTSKEMKDILLMIDKNIDTSLIDIVYMYYGSYYEYNDEWVLSIEKLVNYLNSDILNDKRFDNVIKDDMRNKVLNAKNDINDARDLLVGKKYSRIVITSNMEEEGNDSREFINNLKVSLKDTDSYIIGNSPMAIEMDESFDSELNLITILTMIFIFIVVVITFKSILIPIALVLTIQCSVFTTMGILSLLGTKVYFISLLIVQAVLMGATIDYAIVYTTYYRENRLEYGIKESMINAYNKSIHTIITSSLILCSCTLIVALLTNATSAKICETIAEGAFCSTLLIVFILPGVIASIDKFISKKNK